MASPDCETNPWRPIDPAGDCVEWGTDDDWILATGYWDDDGFYRDIALWNDGALTWNE